MEIKKKLPTNFCCTVVNSIMSSWERDYEESCSTINNYSRKLYRLDSEQQHEETENIETFIRRETDRKTIESKRGRQAVARKVRRLTQ